MLRERKRKRKAKFEPKAFKRGESNQFLETFKESLCID